MRKVTTAGIPPLDSFIGRSGQGTIAKAANGDLVFWVSNAGNVQGVTNATPTGFSAADIVQATSGGDQFDVARIMVRLANGDVWRRENSTWVKWTPIGATDIYASWGGSGNSADSSTFVVLTDGSTPCA